MNNADGVGVIEFRFRQGSSRGYGHIKISTKNYWYNISHSSCFTEN